MLDLITTQSLSAGNAVQARQSKLVTRPDNLFDDSLRIHDRPDARELEPQATRGISESERDASLEAREASERTDRTPTEADAPERDVTDRSPEASTDTDNEPGPPPHPVENEPADEVATPATDSTVTEVKPSADLQALAWQEHLLSLARLASGTKPQSTETSGTGNGSTSDQNATRQATLIETKPSSTPTQRQPESSADTSRSTERATEQDSGTRARATAVVTQDSAQKAESTQQHATEPQSKIDGTFVGEASENSSNQTAGDTKQQADSRLLSALKQSTQGSSAAAKRVDPFAIKEPLTQAPPPAAVVRPTISTNQSPIHLQSVDTSAQGVTDAQSAEERGNIAAVSRGLAAAVRQRGGTVNIQLTPEALGPIKISMSIQQGNVSVQFDAATEQARELLNKHIDSLRANLQGKGFGVERLAVQSSPQSFDTGTRDSSGQSQQDRLTQSNQHDASEGESRGRREHDDPDAHGQQQSTEFKHHWRVAVNTTA
ncbi:MAG: flagellar hook-length control protein FliK [Planctomycetota bacterium]|jgi:flagellar hook-length control protein FliK